jgi:release factor glutamine methyltransferase
VASAPDRLVPGGLLLLEVGAEQAVAVAAELAAAGFGEVESYPDLAGWPRLVVGRWH